MRTATSLPAFLGFLAITMIATASLSEPMTIRGISPGLTHSQVISAIESRGGICAEIHQTSKESRAVQGCWSDKALSDEEVNIFVYLTPELQFESIRFECTATKSCGLSPGAVIGSLIDSEIIPASVLDEWRKDGTTPLNQALRSSIDGPLEITYTNEAGDTLHVQNAFLSGTEKFIRLEVSKERLKGSGAFD